MLGRGRRGTVLSMSIRATISGLINGDGLTSDPAAALEEAGYEGVSAEEFGIALTHFADTSTLAEADALAPVVTRVGPVPLTEEDLPELDLEAGSGDAFSLFTHAVTEVSSDYGESDLDDFDDFDELASAAPDGPGTLADGEPHFGEPVETDSPTVEDVADDPLIDVEDVTTDSALITASASVEEMDWDEAFNSDDPADTATADPGGTDDADDAFDDGFDFDD